MSIVTGKQVAECVFSDIEGFFCDEADFTINKEYDASGLQHASIRGTGSDARIRLSLYLTCNTDLFLTRDEADGSLDSQSIRKTALLIQSTVNQKL